MASPPVPLNAAATQETCLPWALPPTWPVRLGQRAVESTKPLQGRRGWDCLMPARVLGTRAETAGSQRCPALPSETVRASGVRSRAHRRALCVAGPVLPQCWPLPSGSPKPVAPTPLSPRSWLGTQEPGPGQCPPQACCPGSQILLCPPGMRKVLFFSMALVVSPPALPSSQMTPQSSPGNPCPEGPAWRWEVLHGEPRVREGPSRELGPGPARQLAPAQAPASHRLSPCGQHKVYIGFVPLPVSVHSV